MMAPVFSVAVFIYPGGDILDFSGPVEIYNTSPPPEKPKQFKVTTFAQHNPVIGESGTLIYTPNGSFAELEANLQEYDILVIPGASLEVLASLLKSQEGREIAALIKRFSELPPRQETGKRILQSVCTGSHLVALSGILAGRTVTTHHLGYDGLKEIADQAAGGESNTKVVRKRWVDAGTTDAGVRIVNAGGVSSGIDTSLWIIEQLAGKEAADWAAEIAEFERRDQGAAWGV